MAPLPKAQSCFSKEAVLQYSNTLESHHLFWPRCSHTSLVHVLDILMMLRSHKCLCRQEHLDKLKLLLVFATFHVLSHSHSYCRTWEWTHRRIQKGYKQFRSALSLWKSSLQLADILLILSRFDTGWRIGCFLASFSRAPCANFGVWGVGSTTQACRSLKLSRMFKLHCSGPKVQMACGCGDSAQHKARFMVWTWHLT